jgi:hypothetical protein
LPSSIRLHFFHNHSSRSWYFHSIWLLRDGIVIALGRSTGFTIMEKTWCRDPMEFSGCMVLTEHLQNNDLCFCLFLPKMRMPLKPGLWNEATIIVLLKEISVQSTQPGRLYSLSYRNKRHGLWLRFSRSVEILLLSVILERL